MAASGKVGRFNQELREMKTEDKTNLVATILAYSLLLISAGNSADLLPETADWTETPIGAGSFSYTAELSGDLIELTSSGRGVGGTEDQLY